MASRPDPLDHRIHLETHLDDDSEEAARAELRAALAERPRRIPSRFFYDEKGSDLFERICELPEYYPTRAESALLARWADDIAATTRATEVVELGSGAATKTRWLLSALERAGTLRRYVPVDVSGATLERSAHELVAEYPGLTVHGLVADFERHLGEIPAGERRLVLFLGSTIGNFPPARARQFLGEIRGILGPEDSFLLGTDLIKDRAVLEAAYDDAQGVTAAFNLNILEVVNRLTDGDFDPTGFRHRAVWNGEDCWIEMRLVSLAPQRVRLPALDLTLDLEQGEEILTEISSKYDQVRVETLLTGAGMRLRRWYTDPQGRFAASLAVPA
jgi:L-histidine N-alpha-methyltransferase